MCFCNFLLERFTAVLDSDNWKDRDGNVLQAAFCIRCPESRFKDKWENQQVSEVELVCHVELQTQMQDFECGGLVTVTRLFSSSVEMFQILGSKKKVQLLKNSMFSGNLHIYAPHWVHFKEDT